MLNYFSLSMEKLYFGWEETMEILYFGWKENMEMKVHEKK